ncbi:MAG: tyrosine-type recombinase/integrase [Clostridium baratii]|uniref:tyrosine-type recombinase/integrase n=1 Tax=Clostridium baratii TaxID=1561 RepID=UPI002430B5A4|nr:tyrosine-type recombinase/integrase [Clostridium baratii]MBS6006901.1 tyrosine-type recombinase/integrase [Clostridium baratii]
MPIIKSKRSYAAYIQDFIDYCSLKGLSEKTIKSYYQSLTLFTKYLEEEKEILDINKVNKNVVEEYIQFTKERGKYSFIANEKDLNTNYQDKRKDIGKEISVSTLNNYLRNIKVFFNWLYDNELIKFNNVTKAKFIKEKRKVKDQLTDEEYKKLINKIDISKFSEYRDYIIINLIMDTGMRLSECLSITINDIDLVRRTILLSAEVTKGKKDRFVFYSERMAKLINSWVKFKDALKESDLLFPTQRNTILTASNFEKNFRVYRERARIRKNITPHTLRNNFGRRFLLNGGDIFMLSKILGHSSVTVTEKAYLDVTTEDIREKYKRYSPLENMKNR